ncbi:hypothetical protein [Pseudotamlana agarivorans]|uniref:hypothetical protein n=1 Tax=Pseudotamlana agarivorans TaxID=481183 RepID=UPI00083555BE|nr:hypothetical protein [Tamlana agarivorans]
MAYKHRINWVDGMKINKDHFIGFEDAMMQQMIQMNRQFVHQNNYGLLPHTRTNEDAVKLSLSIDGMDTLSVLIHKCFAVTLGGFHIEIDDTIQDAQEISERINIREFIKNDTSQIGYILLAAKPFQRVAIGDVNPSEEPYRRPYVSQGYELSLVSEKDLNTNDTGLNNIVVAKVLKDGDSVTLVDDYIPPCTSIQSHSELRQTYIDVDVYLNKMELYGLQIILKIQQKNQTNELSKIVLSIAKEVLYYLRNTMSSFRNMDKNAPPIDMITKVMSLARIIKGGIDLSIGSGKENLLNYISDWCDVSQVTFENVIDNMVNLEYCHHDSAQAIDKLSEFTLLTHSLFKKLNELEYIGKKSDSSIFVKEDVVIKEPEKKRRRFFME